MSVDYDNAECLAGASALMQRCDEQTLDNLSSFTGSSLVDSMTPPRRQVVTISVSVIIKCLTDMLNRVIVPLFFSD